MRIKRFEEFVSEGLWNKGLNRNKSGIVRKEEGTKVKTFLGTDVVLYNTNWDYNEFIKELFDYDNRKFYELHYDGSYDINKKEKVKNEEFDYIYYVNEKQGLVLNIYSYDDEEIQKDLEIYGDDINKHDYINAIQVFLNALRETSITEDNRNDSMVFVLLDFMDDNDIYNKYDEDYEPMKYRDDFYKKFIDKFHCNTLKNIGSYEEPIIVVDITFDNYEHLKEMQKYTKNYFLNL